MKKVYNYPSVDIMILSESLMDSSNTSGIKQISGKGLDSGSNFNFKNYVP